MARKGRGGWVVNPSLTVKINYKLRLKGHGARLMKDMPCDSDPALARLLLLLAEKRGQSLTGKFSKSQLAMLMKRGLIVRETGISSEVPDLCTFSREHLKLIEWIDVKSVLTESTNNYTWSSSAWIQETNKPPLSLHRFGIVELPRGMSAPLLWVEQRGTGIANPYAISRKDLKVLRDLYHGKVQVSSLDSELVTALVLAGILVSHKTKGNSWKEKIALAAKDYQRSGVAVLRGVLDPYRIASLRARYRKMYEEGYFWLDTIQVREKRSFFDSDTVGEVFHRMFSEMISGVVQEKVVPTYNIIASYDPGAVLNKHRDKSLCRWNISLMLGAQPEFKTNESWPIYLDLPDGVREFNLHPGDALLYRGTDVPHWRKALSLKHRAEVLLFHFVPADHMGKVYLDESEDLAS